MVIYQLCQASPITQDLVSAERLYQVEHPRYVKLVDEVCNVAEGESGYWISKKWYKGIETTIFNP
jgi:hypothetical protein